MTLRSYELPACSNKLSEPIFRENCMKLTTQSQKGSKSSSCKTNQGDNTTQVDRQSLRKLAKTLFCTKEQDPDLNYRYYLGGHNCYDHKSPANDHKHKSKREKHFATFRRLGKHTSRSGFDDGKKQSKDSQEDMLLFEPKLKTTELLLSIANKNLSSNQNTQQTIVHRKAHIAGDDVLPVPEINTNRNAGFILANTDAIRTVAISNLPKEISITSLLNQVYGGPLEKIKLIGNETFYSDDQVQSSLIKKQTNPENISVLLCFGQTQAAKAFYQYSKSGLFKINDIHLETVWIPDLLVSPGVNGDSENDNTLVCRLMLGEEKARRVLVFKKPIQCKKSRNERRRPGYPDPTDNYSGLQDFDVEDIRKDFESYGAVIEIMAVVSRKLCFGVHYYDVRTAIRVKDIVQGGNKSEDQMSDKDSNGNKLNKRDLELRKKYIGWYVWYGKDPADRGVPF